MNTVKYASEYARYCDVQRGYNFNPLPYDVWLTWWEDFLRTGKPNSVSGSV